MEDRHACLSSLSIMKRLIFIALLPTLCAPRDPHAAAAASLTDRCAASRLATWNIRGLAAGGDCRVLLVDTPMVLEDSLVEAIHYGSGAYAIVDGGVRHFTRERDFRGVVYRDGTGRVWTYGDVPEHAEELQPCR